MSWSLRKQIATAALVVAVGSSAAVAQQVGYGGGPYPFGTPVTEAEIAAWNLDVRPDGTGLSPGSGTYDKGKEIYAAQCAACHGVDLNGVRNANLPQGGGAALIGGRGSLNTPKFKMTVESYWPYATTLYDYILRAMPYTAPSSLKPDEVYALCAYILAEAKIIDPKTTMDAKSLPKVEMPNKDGFFQDNRPFPVKIFD